MVPLFTLLGGTRSSNVGCVVPFFRLLDGTKLSERFGMVPFVALYSGTSFAQSSGKVPLGSLNSLVKRDEYYGILSDINVFEATPFHKKF